MWNKKKRRPSVAIQTLIGAGTTLQGDLQFAGGCHLDGHVHGNVRGGGDGPAMVSISAQGSVEGTVRAAHVVLNGTVQGDVYAEERMEMGASACVTGNVHYRLLEMSMGAEVNGQLVHITGEQRMLAHGDAMDDAPADPVLTAAHHGGSE